MFGRVIKRTPCSNVDYRCSRQLTRACLCLLGCAGIDTHMHRIFSTIGWTKNAKNPDATRLQFESWFPNSGRNWQDVNLLVVGIGQQAQQTPGVFIRKCLRCKDPVAALKFASRIGVNLDYRERPTRGAFNTAEQGLDYCTLAKQNALFWVRARCSASKQEETTQYLVKKGVKQDIMDACGKRFND